MDLNTSKKRRTESTNNLPINEQNMAENNSINNISQMSTSSVKEFVDDRCKKLDGI